VNRNEQREKKAPTAPSHARRDSCPAAEAEVTLRQTITSESEFERWLLAALARERFTIAQSRPSFSVESIETVQIDVRLRNGRMQGAERECNRE
jgi:hypothetical protein